MCAEMPASLYRSLGVMESYALTEQRNGDSRLRRPTTRLLLRKYLSLAIGCRRSQGYDRQKARNRQKHCTFLRSELWRTWKIQAAYRKCRLTDAQPLTTPNPE